MLATAREITGEEISSILDDLAKRGHSVPAPEDVKVVAAEDHDGDPAIFLTVTFSKKEDPAKLPLRRVSPLVEELRERIKSSDDMPGP